MTGPESFGARYLVAAFPTSGVVVDTETGNYFRVDAAAACVCEVLGVPDVVSPVSEVATRLRIPPGHAERLMADTRRALDAAPVLGTPTGPYHFFPEKTGYGLWHAGQRVLGVTHDLVVHMPPGQGIERSPLLEFYVRALAPKIMFLRGLTVLHASSCTFEGALVAFSGQSGAGKTTTAHAFVKAGATLVSEDLVVLKPGAPRPSVVIGSEARVHAWSKRTTEALAAGATQASSEALAGMAAGDHQAIDTIFFLDVTRRSATDFVLRRIREADALLSLMANDFLGASSRDEWRRYFSGAKAIAAALNLFEVVAPLGLENLNASARRYISSWTSYVPDGSEVPSQA